MAHKYDDIVQYDNAYNTKVKVRIDMDKFANDLYIWKKDLINYNREDLLEEYLDKKPQIEDYLIVTEAPSTYLAKSSIGGKR